MSSFIFCLLLDACSLTSNRPLVMAGILLLIPDPCSSRRAYLESTGTNNKDQGSVVVLRWRTTHSSFVAMSHVHCNQSYRGFIFSPGKQHLIPDPLPVDCCSLEQWIRDQLLHQ